MREELLLLPDLTRLISRLFRKGEGHVSVRVYPSSAE